MKRLCIRDIATCALTVMLIAALAIPAAAQREFTKSPFTTEDALVMKSFRIQTMTDDGRYLIGSISSRKDRLNRDHFRYGDPTYISPGSAEYVLIDTETLERTPLFDEKVQARGFEWNPDGTLAAFFLREGDDFFLHTYDRNRNRVSKVDLKTDKPVSSGSMLEWTPDGDGLLIELRDTGWKETARAEFLEATEGPIIVYDSEKPFLKWDRIRALSQLAIPARIDLDSREVTELLPEGRYGSFRQAEDGSFVAYVQSFPIKTTYTRGGGGTEYEMLMLPAQGGEPVVLRERSDDRISVDWNPDNTMYAYAEKGNVLLQKAGEGDPVNLTKDKVEPKIEDGDTTEVRFSVMRWSPDGSQLLLNNEDGYWLIGQDGEGLEMVYERPPEEERDTAPRISVNQWSPDGRYLYMTYSARDKWERGYLRYDLQTRETDEIFLDDNLYSGWRMSEDGEKFFYEVSDGDTPDQLIVTDKDFRVRKNVIELNPWIGDKKLTKSELIKWLDVDGEELYGILYYPVDYEEGKKYPLVCEIYEQFFNNGFNTNMNLITNAGFFGFRPSVDLREGYPGEAWVRGVTTGINKLIERGLVDPEKLGVHGTSYGGYATNLLIAQTDRFAAAINISGKANIISFLADSPKIGTRNYSAAEVGQDRIGETLWEAPMKYIEHSAVFFADRIETPLLCLTGEGDWNVPATNQREIYYALRRLGKKCVWVNYYNGGHGAGASSTESDFHDHWNRIVAWYQQHFDAVDEEKKK